MIVSIFSVSKTVDEVRRADVALDELVVRQRRDLLEVREARAVVEAVKVQDLVLRVLLAEQNDDVRRNESSTSRDQDVSIETASMIYWLQGWQACHGRHCCCGKLAIAAQLCFEQRTRYA